MKGKSRIKILQSEVVFLYCKEDAQLNICFIILRILFNSSLKTGDSFPRILSHLESHSLHKISLWIMNIYLQGIINISYRLLVILNIQIQLCQLKDCSYILWI